MATLEDFVLLSSFFAGIVAPSILILVSLCRGNPDGQSEISSDISSADVSDDLEEDCDNDVKLGENVGISGNISSQEDEEGSDDISLEGECSFPPGSKKILERLRLNCNNLLCAFPLPDSDRADMSSLIDSIISSPKFVQAIEKKDKKEKVNDIASLIMGAAMSTFTADEQMYIRKKVDHLKKISSGEVIIPFDLLNEIEGDFHIKKS